MIPDGGASLLAPFLLVESWGLFMLLAELRNWSVRKFLKISFIFCAVLAFVASMGHARSLGYVPIAEIMRAQRQTNLTESSRARRPRGRFLRAYPRQQHNVPTR